MRRWWERNSLSTTLTIMALSTAWLIRHTQAAIITEIYFFLVSPFQSQRQLLLEDKLTNARILELEAQVTELKQQNQQFKQLLDYVEPLTPTTITAPVVGRSADRWWHQITLGKGSEDGIQVGYTVMGIGGVVGRVIQITPHTSRVLLVSDAISRVGATVSRNRNLGYVRGKDSQTLMMQFFTKVADVKPGDEIVTSPLSNLYPPGLPLGRVKSVKSDSSLSPTAEIELSAPIEHLEWVTVKPFKPKLN